MKAISFCFALCTQCGSDTQTYGGQAFGGNFLVLLVNTFWLPRKAVPIQIAEGPSFPIFEIGVYEGTI